MTSLICTFRVVQAHECVRGTVLEFDERDAAARCIGKRHKNRAACQAQMSNSGRTHKGATAAAAVARVAAAVAVC